MGHCKSQVSMTSLSELLEEVHVLDSRTAGKCLGWMRRCQDALVILHALVVVKCFQAFGKEICQAKDNAAHTTCLDDLLTDTTLSAGSFLCGPLRLPSVQPAPAAANTKSSGAAGDCNGNTVSGERRRDT